MSNKCDCCGCCPKCNSTNIEWGERTCNNSLMTYDGICTECNCIFTEVYAYNKTSIDYKS